MDAERLFPLMGPREATLLVRAVARDSGYTVEALLGPDRTRDVSRARHHAMRLVRERCGLTYAAIGRMFGGRDPATVLLGVRRARREAELLGRLAKDVDDDGGDGGQE